MPPSPPIGGSDEAEDDGGEERAGPTTREIAKYPLIWRKTFTERVKLEQGFEQDYQDMIEGQIYLAMLVEKHAPELIAPLREHLDRAYDLGFRVGAAGDGLAMAKAAIGAERERGPANARQTANKARHEQAGKQERVAMQKVLAVNSGVSLKACASLVAENLNKKKPDETKAIQRHLSKYFEPKLGKNGAKCRTKTAKPEVIEEANRLFGKPLAGD